MFKTNLSDFTRIWDSNPYPGMIRLRGGAYTNEGLLEVYCNGLWGTVCDDGFDNDDAVTVCRQLGYNNYVFFSHITM